MTGGTVSDRRRTVLTTGRTPGSDWRARSSSPAAGSGRSDRCALRRRLGRSERPRERRTWTWRRCSSTSRMRRRAVGVVDRLKPWGLVNNAGSSFSGAIEDVGDAEAREALETMVLAPMRLARLSLGHMRAAGGGRIVQISSIYGLTTTPLTGWYQGSKHAIEGLSDALRMEVARDGIAVVLIEPGGVDTGIWDSADEDFDQGRSSRYRGAYERTKQGIAL